jgi:hypothetical protein
MGKKLIFLLLFAVLALTASQVNYAAVIGTEGAQFTFFQFIGPIGGQLFSPMLGALAVVLVKAAGAMLNNAAFEWMTLARLLPAAAGAYYYGTRKKPVLALPLVAIALFLLHPEGAAAWAYSLFWLVPFIATRFDHPLSRAFGSTFTAHAVGSVVFLYAFNIPAAVWWGLIPVTLAERTLFAFGITGAAIALNTIASRVSQAMECINVDPRLVLRIQLRKSD